MAKIIVLDKISKDGLALLDAAEGIEYEVRTGLKGEDLRQALAEFDGAICRSGVKITAESLEGNRRLKAIVRAGVGTDNIDRQTATRLGIVVMNTPAGNTISTAEHAFALMLALSRNVAAANQSLVEGRWDRSAYMGTQLADKTLGVVGLGRIGTEVAKRALAFEMRVIGYDPFLSAEAAAKLGIERVETVHDMLPQDRLPDGPHAADAGNEAPDRRQGNRDAEARRAADQRGPRRHLRRSGAGRGAEERQTGRRGPGCLREGALHDQPAVRHAERALHAAPGREHRGSADAGRRRRRAAAGELPHDRGDSARGERGCHCSRRRWKRCAAIWTSPIAWAICWPRYTTAAWSPATLQYRGEVADKETKLLTAAFCAGLAEIGDGRRSQHRQRRTAAPRTGHSDPGRNAEQAQRVQLDDHGDADQQRADVHRGRHAVRQQHAASDSAGRLPARGVPGRQLAGVRASATCPA